MEEESRLPTALWVDAHIRQCTAEALPVYVINRGAYAAGTVLLKLNGLENGCTLLIQQRDLDGVLGWMKALDQETVEETEADAYIRRAVARDSDLWVIEIEDRDRRNPFEGKMF